MKYANNFISREIPILSLYAFGKLNMDAGFFKLMRQTSITRFLTVKFNGLGCKSYLV
jgi:hypothetical protein